MYVSVRNVGASELELQIVVSCHVSPGNLNPGPPSLQPQIKKQKKKKMVVNFKQYVDSHV